MGISQSGLSLNGTTGYVCAASISQRRMIIEGFRMARIVRWRTALAIRKHGFVLASTRIATIHRCHGWRCWSCFPQVNIIRIAHGRPLVPIQQISMSTRWGWWLVALSAPNIRRKSGRFSGRLVLISISVQILWTRYINKNAARGWIIKSQSWQSEHFFLPIVLARLPGLPHAGANGVICNNRQLKIPREPHQILP